MSGIEEEMDVEMEEKTEYVDMSLAYSGPFVPYWCFHRKNLSLVAKLLYGWFHAEYTHNIANYNESLVEFDADELEEETGNKAVEFRKALKELLREKLIVKIEDDLYLMKGPFKKEVLIKDQ
jgi:hypothetical protein